VAGGDPGADAVPAGAMRAAPPGLAALAALSLAALCLGGALALEGAQAPGRLALRLCAPTLAAPLLTDPALRGVALFQSGDYAGAGDAFRSAGPAASYNRAAALALEGDYALALASYRAVLARDPADREAAENRAVIAALHEGVTGEILPGTEAAGDGAGADDMVSPFDEAVSADGGAAQRFEQPRSALSPQTALSRAEQVRRVPTAQAVAANRRWLETFPDDPGLYLKAAILAEQARRARLGLAPEAPVSRW